LKVNRYKSQLIGVSDEVEDIKKQNEGTLEEPPAAD
jgi:hypothetical protein